jgi:hypothetical protein
VAELSRGDTAHRLYFRADHSARALLRQQRAYGQTQADVCAELVGRREHVRMVKSTGEERITEASEMIQHQKKKKKSIRVRYR